MQDRRDLPRPPPSSLFTACKADRILSLEHRELAGAAVTKR
jgi:hypothetical protein